MAEISRPWDGQVTGDAGPYTSADWQATWLSLFASNRITEGVFRGQLFELLVSAPGGVSPVLVDDGRAIVDGTWYESTGGPVPFVVVSSAPGTTRIDTVILHKDPTAQTVRLLLLPGVDSPAPTPPALTQTPGGIWDIAIFDVLIDEFGVIVLLDRRDFIGPQHALRHAENATDELFVEDLGTGSAVSGQVPTADGAGGLAMATPGGGGALVREGGNLVEASTTSVVAVDLLTTSGLSISPTTPILILANYRKNAGVAASGFIAIKVNTIEMFFTVICTSTGSGADNGLIESRIGSRITSYENAGFALFAARSSVPSHVSFSTGLIPLVTITDIIIRGRISANTFFADEMHVYSLATS